MSVSTFTDLKSYTMENKIGATGAPYGFSQASRALNLCPDLARLKKYDIYLKANQKTYNILAVLSLLTVSGTVVAFSTGHWITGIIAAIVSVVLLFLWLLYRGLIKGGAYESGLLIPGMVSSVQPLELIALADMRSDETTYTTPQWGCKKIEPEALPLHTLQVGEKVPCVAMFGMAGNGLRNNFEPRPVSWATADNRNIEQAIRAIDEEEWALLYDVLDRETAVSQTDITMIQEHI